MTVTSYQIHSPRLPSMLIAVASDLHGCPHKDAVDALQQARPDLILIPGDLMEDKMLADPSSSGYAFLRECVSIAPTFYSLGNHEIGCYHKGNPWRHPTPIPLSDQAREEIARTGAVLLDNDEVTWNGVRICGLTSGINGKENKADAEVLARFAKGDAPRILLCHHPEYFYPDIAKTDIELTLCGHAHGGQWCFFGRGVYSPGQGIFPKYTAGVLDGRCVISRGLGNHTRIPRICNPCELLLISLNQKAQENQV
ncbi:MAG: metallophosphoesterase [Clostridia bacterium]|nr:metallophosphoesterase [Clostridia bacterium]